MLRMSKKGLKSGVEKTQGKEIKVVYITQED